MAFPRIEGYVVTEKIGSGSYSTVYKAYNKVGGRQTLAIKCVDKSRVNQSGAAVDNLVSEIRLLKTLSHPHIVHMHNFTWDDKNIYIITEYCNAGDLSRYIRRSGRLPEPQVRYFLQQLVSALLYMHEKGVVHMDLKPHNLLLHKAADGRLTLKVADFGFAAPLAAVGGGARGSPLYMAPELAAGRRAPTADLWSVGVILYECLLGRAPYASATLRDLLHKIERRDPIQIPPDARISAGCRALLAGLLRHDPAERLSYAELFAHEYLDLAHMPTADNYEKGVQLVREAVASEAAGEARAALRGYTEGLRYLLPAAAVEPDAVRRAALTAKLTRYMERAEEIKLLLSQDGAPDPALPAPSAARGERGAARGERGAARGEAAGQEELPAHPVHQVRADEGGGGGARGVLRRVLARRADLPPLRDADCTLSAEGAGGADGAGGAGGEEEACRIT